jgi:DNA repair exonuclease SbcCD ATPase subunit
MTMSVENLTRRFAHVFEAQQATALAEAMHDTYATLVRADDFNELKGFMGELAQAQRELVQAQGRTEARMEELAQAQTRTEVEIKRLSQQVGGLAQEMGGLSRSVSYSLENEAYRLLPAYLKNNYGIVLDKRLVRTDIGGEEINIFALGQRKGTPIVLVGETKLQFDRRRKNRDALSQALEQLERKVEAVQPLHPDREVVRLLITHYARPAVQEEARKRGVLIIQSFDW